MSQYNPLILAVFIVGLFLTCCNDIAEKSEGVKWYEETKAEILKQSNFTVDSTTFTFNKDSTYKNEHLYSNGQEFLLRGYSDGVLRFESYFRKNTDFELRREICNNGNYGFEGILYKGEFFGVSTWWYCSGKINRRGIRHNGKKIGLWTTWDENGAFLEETKHMNIEKLDSMPNIKYM